MVGLDCTMITGGSILGELSRMLILILMVFLVMVMLLMMMMMTMTKTTMMTCGLCQVSRARQVGAMWGGEAIVFA